MLGLLITLYLCICVFVYFTFEFEKKWRAGYVIARAPMINTRAPDGANNNNDILQCSFPIH